jgi:hypothetical protein
MPPKDLASYARVAELLSYDPLTGIFTWKIAPGGRQDLSGKVAGCLRQGRYSVIYIDGKEYKAHRLAWLLYTGSWPKAQIDHINRIRHDNRIENLREATKSENQINSAMYRNNKSGYRGVCFHKATGKWQAEVKRNKKPNYLGVFETAEEAYKQVQNYDRGAA